MPSSSRLNPGQSLAGVRLSATTRRRIAIATPLFALLATPALLRAESRCTGFLTDPTVWTLATPGMPALPPGATSHRANFGLRLAAADFNADGAADLAIAHRQSSPSNTPGAKGSVIVLAGGPAGLGIAAAKRLTGEQIETDGPRAFGETLATGDFDGDGYTDLAVGAYGLGLPVAGKVYVFAGGAQGIDPGSAQILHRDVAAIAGVAGNEDGFGMQLVAGRFDDDLYDDLAIGATKAFDDPALGQSVIHLLFGSANGLTGAGSVALQYLAPGGERIDIYPRRALDTNADGINELALSFSPQIGPSLPPYACLVHDLRAIVPPWSCFGQHSFNLTGLLSSGFAAGDFDGDHVDDLVTGEDRYSHQSVVQSGRVLQWRGLGSSVGISEPAAHILMPAFDVGYPDFGRFGTGVAAADLDGDGYTDLVVGEPGWSDTGLPASSGRLHMFRGSSAGLNAMAAQQFSTQGLTALLPPQANLRLGERLQTADFNADGCLDLAIATPAADAPGVVDAGAVFVLANEPSVLFADGFDK